MKSRSRKGLKLLVRRPPTFFEICKNLGSNYLKKKIRTPGKGFEPLSAEAQPLPCLDLEAVAVPLG